MKPLHLLGCKIRVVPFLLVLLTPPTVSFAASPYFKDVCASGCTYSSVQAAIDSITDSGPTKVYTVFVDSGIVSSDTSITTSGKSYINFVGRGMEVSVVQASAAWYQNVGNLSTPPDFFDLSNSTNITLSNLTIDARTQDPGNFGTSLTYTAVSLGGAPDKIVVESSEILGVTYGLWEQLGGDPAKSVQVFNSKVLASNYGILIQQTAWLIFSSDIRAVDRAVTSGVVAAAIGIEAGISGTVKSTIWGSHVHAESSLTGKTYPVAAITTSMTGGSLSIIGSTLHLKMTTTDGGSVSRKMFSLDLNSTGGATPKTINLVGSDLLYESPTGLTQGLIGGIGAISFNTASTEVRLVGVSAIDGGGSGGSHRAGIVSSALPNSEPTILSAGSRIPNTESSSGITLTLSSGALFNTVNMQSGLAAFPSSNTVPVTLPVPMPNTSYRVGISANANETIYVTSKTTTGFTLKSSKAGSTASVDWTVLR